MYGTRAAADGWQEEYSTLLVSLGFRQGEAVPNVFYHSTKQIVTSVHGDDFTSEGPADALDWMEACIAETYEITGVERCKRGSRPQSHNPIAGRAHRVRMRPAVCGALHRRVRPRRRENSCHT